MKKNVKYYLNPKNFFTIAAAVCMILAAACRCVGIIPQLQGLSQNEMAERLALPVAACLLYAATVAFCGKKSFWLSLIPTVFGVLFFILRLFTNDNISGQPLSRINILLNLLLCIVITVIYTATVTGALRTKFILSGSILLPLAYHAGVEDYSAIKLMGDRLTWSSIILEAGILFILLGLFFVSLGLKKAVVHDPDAARKVVPPIPGGSMKVSDPEPEQEPEPESPAVPEPVPVIIEEPEEAAFAEPEAEMPAESGSDTSAGQNPDAEPEREAAVPAERLSFAERLGLKKRRSSQEEAPEALPEENSEAEEEDLTAEQTEAAESSLENE